MVLGQWCISSYDKAWELFSCMMERHSDVHVELGDDAKYVVKGEGEFSFQLDSGGSLDA
jgi:hypothetical protein